MTYLIIFRGHRGPRKKNFLCSKFSYVSDANFNLTYFISFRGPGLDPVGCDTGDEYLANVTNVTCFAVVTLTCHRFQKC